MSLLQRLEKKKEVKEGPSGVEKQAHSPEDPFQGLKQKIHQKVIEALDEESFRRPVPSDREEKDLAHG
jgi:hypothetical protein